MRQTPSEQQLLPLTVTAVPTSLPFFVGRCNQEAWSWMQAWPTWPRGGLVIWGAPGCGTSYLGRIWQQKSQALCLEPSGPDTDLFSLARLPHIWVPHSEKWLANARAAERLLALYNTVHERGGTFLLTGQPTSYTDVLPDLTSRLKALPTITMGIPDDTVFEQTLTHLFNQAQTPLAEGAVSFLAKQTRRTFRDAQQIVMWLASESLRCQQKISVPFLKKKLSFIESVF